MSITRNFVTFYSPGTFVAETTTKEISSWDPQVARRMALKVNERYDAKPYGFRFSTRSRGDGDLDSKVTKQSPMYYFGCRVRTLEEIEAQNDPSNRILISNMKCNRWDRMVEPLEGWRWSQPLEKDDVVLP